MKYSIRAVLALAMAAGLAGTAGAQSMATPGPAPDSWGSAVPGPIGPSRSTARPPYAAAPYATEGYGSSMPPGAGLPLVSPDSTQAPLGAGGFSTGGQYFAR